MLHMLVTSVRSTFQATVEHVGDLFDIILFDNFSIGQSPDADSSETPVVEEEEEAGPLNTSDPGPPDPAPVVCGIQNCSGTSNYIVMVQPGEFLIFRGLKFEKKKEHLILNIFVILSTVLYSKMVEKIVSNCIKCDFNSDITS